MFVQLKYNDLGLKNFIIKTYGVVFQMNEVGMYPYIGFTLFAIDY
ncbi:hypothetical protein LBBP_02332 [Leptospira borgpetersenii serovar Ballum]|uniref:Uncharacterized protein n=1 Tax=Leptospira borgpetersenii serovar Ballum TaxID=280505 RepID=A0A0S2ISV0_LEPBO|nr:hypothetical protein LBBP_02332 [Leptospira borgpetersenii serovar Ballum]APY24979.1 Uncharacterized protein LB4E_1848 [Leptospira borgpetersenii str. 4E]